MVRAARAGFSALGPLRQSYARATRVLRGDLETTTKGLRQAGSIKLYLPPQLPHSPGRLMSAAQEDRKRKRTVVPGAKIVKGKESAAAIQFSNAGQFRDALRDENAEGVKGGTSWASHERASGACPATGIAADSNGLLFRSSALTGFRNQIATQLDDHPLPAADPKVKLVANFLERSPGAEDIFDAWDVAISVSVSSFSAL
jgi:hypothetical protein